jgi:hypothetical protein
MTMAQKNIGFLLVLKKFIAVLGIFTLLDG